MLEGIRWVLKTGAHWRDLPPECPLIEPTLDASAAPEKIQRLTYDKAADSNALRQRLAARVIGLIALQLRSRRTKVQDRRKLRRYRRRWKIERTFT